MTPSDPLPADLAAAHAMILAERTARRAAEARAADAEAQISGARLEIERLQLLLVKARREQYGQSSERGAKIIAQLELQLAELEETVAQEETAAEMAAPAGPAPRSTSQRKPARRPLPDHLPRERIVHPAPCACPKCGGVVRKLGEDVTETLECVPRRWKVVEHVREKFTCRSCEAISQPPAPSHPIARGRAGPNLLALVMVSKYGHHLPLTRQSAIYAREGVEIDVSTLADWVGATAATAMPLVDAIRAHVFAAERLHADDTTVPVLAKDKTRITRLWTYVRDDRPFAGRAPPAAAFFYSPDRGGGHPERQSAPILAELESWLRAQRERTSRKSEIGKAIDYALKRWTALTRFMADGRICLSNNAAERALRGIAVGRHNWTFAGSDRGGERAAAMYTLIETAKLNGVDPQAWLADVLARLADHPAKRLDDLFPWRWHQLQQLSAA